MPLQIDATAPLRAREPRADRSPTPTSTTRSPYNTYRNTGSAADADRDGERRRRSTGRAAPGRRAVQVLRARSTRTGSTRSRRRTRSSSANIEEARRKGLLDDRRGGDAARRGSPAVIGDPVRHSLLAGDPQRGVRGSRARLGLRRARGAATGRGYDAVRAMPALGIVGLSGHDAAQGRRRGRVRRAVAPTRPRSRASTRSCCRDDGLCSATPPTAKGSSAACADAGLDVGGRDGARARRGRRGPGRGARARPGRRAGDGRGPAAGRGRGRGRASRRGADATVDARAGARPRTSTSSSTPPRSAWPARRLPIDRAAATGPVGRRPRLPPGRDAVPAPAAARPGPGPSAGSGCSSTRPRSGSRHDRPARAARGDASRRDRARRAQ